jgi:hypothetical protein
MSNQSILFIKVIVIFSVLTLSAATACQDINTSRQPREAGSQRFSFKIVNNKTILNARIEDSRNLRIVLDSGMGWDGLLITNPDLADSIVLRNPTVASIAGAGNSGNATAIFSDSMSFIIGSEEFKDQRIVILREGGFRGASFDGVTGYSIFGHYSVEINYDNTEIVLHVPGGITIDKSWTELPIYFKENMIPWINVSIASENEKPVPINCYIDYASSEAIELLLKPGQKFNMPAETEDYYLGRGLSGDITGQKGKISKVIIGPYELTGVMAAFAPAEVRSKQRGADGVVANNLLRRFNLIFDYQNNKLYIKPNSYFNEPF